MSTRPSSMAPVGGKRHFTTTQWSVVLAAAKTNRREAQIALAQLCEAYWYPLYQIEPFHELTPEKLYERQWVLTLLDPVLESLRIELATAGKAEHFEQFNA